MRKGVLSFHPQLFQTLKERNFQRLVASLQPNVSELVKLLNFSFPTDTALSVHEEIVADHLKSYIRTLKGEKLCAFLRYVTAADVQPDLIKVAFSGEVNKELMSPQAATCGSVLILSRYYMTCESLVILFDHLLSNSSLWNTFSIL